MTDHTHVVTLVVHTLYTATTPHPRNYGIPLQTYLKLRTVSTELKTFLKQNQSQTVIDLHRSPEFQRQTHRATTNLLLNAFLFRPRFELDKFHSIILPSKAYSTYEKLPHTLKQNKMRFDTVITTDQRNYSTVKNQWEKLKHSNTTHAVQVAFNTFFFNERHPYHDLDFDHDVTPYTAHSHTHQLTPNQKNAQETLKACQNLFKTNPQTLSTIQFDWPAYYRKTDMARDLEFISTLAENCAKIFQPPRTMPENDEDNSPQIEAFFALSVTPFFALEEHSKSYITAETYLTQKECLVKSFTTPLTDIVTNKSMAQELRHIVTKTPGFPISSARMRVSLCRKNSKTIHKFNQEFIQNIGLTLHSPPEKIPHAHPLEIKKRTRVQTPQALYVQIDNYNTYSQKVSTHIATSDHLLHKFGPHIKSSTHVCIPHEDNQNVRESRIVHHRL